jgi:arginase family enzyme
LIVTEVNPDHDRGGEVARLVDGLVAALARQLLSRVGLRTIRS